MAANKESRKEYWKRKWLSKYRLVVMDDSTYEEKTSFRLSRLNIFVFGSLFAFVLITLTTVLISAAFAAHVQAAPEPLPFKTITLEAKINDHGNYHESTVAYPVTGDRHLDNSRL